MRRALLAAALVLAAAVLLPGTGCRRDRHDDTQPSPTEAPTITPSPSLETPTTAVTPVGPTFAPGPRAEESAMSFQGRERTWRLYIPASVKQGEAAPLVIGLHGGVGSGEQFARNTRFDDEAEGGGFFVVYPDGTGIAQTWNAGACCGAAERDGVDDVGFISALIEDIASRYPVDRSRVYAVGHSNGAMMALRLACERPALFAAVGLVAGSLETDCNPGLVVPVVMIHGDADENHPIEGGSGPNSLSGEDFNSVADSMEALRTVNGCSAETQTEVAGAVTTTRWDCPDGTDVVLEVIAGGSHAWPGGTRMIPRVIGEPSKALDATAELWRFLAPHRR